MPSDSLPAVEDLEVSLLLEAVHRQFGHDLRMYRPQPLLRRLRKILKAHGLATISSLQERVLHAPDGMAMLLRGLMDRPSALLNESGRMKALRDAMVPWLSSCAAPKIWIADCVAPEDVFAISLLLAEEKLDDKCTVFVTSPHELLVSNVASGCFPATRLAEYEEEYSAGGGVKPLSDYCSIEGDVCHFGEALRSNLIFAEYNLSTDASFNEFHLIVHPTGIAEFTDNQRARALKLFNESLSVFGMLNIGKLAQKQDAIRPIRYRTLSDEYSLYLRVA